jgi:RNA ligase
VELQYERLSELNGLIEQRLITKRKHPSLSLWIYNYSPSAQFMPLGQWTEALKDCRGLILDDEGQIVARPFRKFWNYEQVLDQIPSGEPFTVWEKLDGSLGVVCNYKGHLVVATRGSFESDQAIWADAWLRARDGGLPLPGLTYLFEIIYPDNRIVVDYGQRKEMVLLAVLDATGVDQWGRFADCLYFTKARRFDGITDFSIIESDPQFAGQEGFVIQWESGFRAKVKLTEYKRLHRLITHCSTRTIWEMLRLGANPRELFERVPEDFKTWALHQIEDLVNLYEGTYWEAVSQYHDIPPCVTRKEFAEFAKAKENPSLIFSLLDGRDIEDAVWKLVEPKWATPFRSEGE